MSPKEVVIVIITADGKDVTENLIPGGTIWEAFHDKDKTPSVGALLRKNDMENILSLVDEESSKKLEGLTEGVVVITNNKAEVFAA